MAALDSLIGDGLAPSPYRECMAECERLRADVERYRWLREHMGHYDVDADYDVEGRNVPALAHVSDRIWYHATDCMADTLDAAIDAARAAQQGGMMAFEVRYNDDGTLDEIVGTGPVHLEQMDTGHWWIGFGNKLMLHVHLHSRRNAKIAANVIDERAAQG